MSDCETVECGGWLTGCADVSLVYERTNEVLLSLVRWFVRLFVSWFVGWLVGWFVGSLVRWFVGSLVRWW